MECRGEGQVRVSSLKLLVAVSLRKAALGHISMPFKAQMLSLMASKHLPYGLGARAPRRDSFQSMQLGWPSSPSLPALGSGQNISRGTIQAESLTQYRPWSV